MNQNLLKIVAKDLLCPFCKNKLKILLGTYQCNCEFELFIYSSSDLLTFILRTEDDSYGINLDFEEQHVIIVNYNLLSAGPWVIPIPSQYQFTKDYWLNKIKILKTFQ